LYIKQEVVIGDVIVIVLAIGLKLRGLNPAENDEFLRAIKSVARLPSEGK
jgi:hypothetical protein